MYLFNGLGYGQQSAELTRLEQLRVGLGQYHGVFIELQGQTVFGT